MDRASSLVRRNVAFAGVACLAVLVALMRPSPGVAVRTTFAKAFPGFEPAKARAVEVSRTVKRDGKDAKESVRVAQAGADAWVVESASGYPARLASVKRFLDGVAAVEVKNEPTSNPEKFAQFAGPDGYADVRVLGDGGAVLASFGVGKGNAEGSWSDRYVRLDEVAAGVVATPGPGRPPKGRVVVAKGGDLDEARTDVTAWVEGRLWPSFVEGDVQEFSVEQRSKERTVLFVRGKKGEKDADDPWDMKKPEEGKGLPDRVRNLVNTLVGASLSRVVGAETGAEADAKYGFDKPDLVVTATGRVPAKPSDPLPEWTLTVGKKSEAKDMEGWFVRRATNGHPDPFVLLVPDYGLSEFRNEPATFVEKKPEPPAPPAPPTPPVAPAMEGEPAMAEPGMGDAAMSEGGGAPPAPPAPAPAPAPAPGMGETPAMGETPPPPPPAPPAMDGK